MKYFWSRGEHSYFNNQYYKTIADPTDYALQCMWEAKSNFSFTGHTYPDMNKVASQIINLDNFCEAAFLCLFDTSTSILIPLYI